jgi:hypothetical protein
VAGAFRHDGGEIGGETADLADRGAPAPVVVCSGVIATGMPKAKVQAHKGLGLFAVHGQGWLPEPKTTLSTPLRRI